jgi:ABC-2 type transport system permease protein
MQTLVHNLKGIYTLWLRDVTRFSRDRGRIIASLAQPILFLFVFGGGLSPVISDLSGGRLDYTRFMFPGILAMAVLFTAIFSAVSIVWDREFGFLKEVMVAPVSRTSVALGKVAGGSTIALFQGLLILLFAPLLGIRMSLPQIVSLIGLMLLLGAVMTSLGILVAARQRTMEGFHVIMNFLLLPLFFLSGAFFPLQGVPLWMSILSRLDPVTYGVDPLRQVVLARELPAAALAEISLHPVIVDAAILMAFGVAFLFPAILLFRKQD